jgi:DNA mismatch repair protein MutL
MSATRSQENISRIHILPDELANRIAAGEVVERPASVVKELVENAIDAGATRIRVDVESGGKKRIQVLDNGSGMSREDTRLAFFRHATSKIGQAGDLEAIGTLGFRGEALPSIGSVARVRLTTLAREGEAGTLVSVEGGKGPVVGEAGCPKGTTVEVEQLFYNTPARRKFLKADGTEFSYINQVVTQQALAHPEIHFTLSHNNRQIVDTLPTDQRLYRIAELFGAEMARELVRVEAEEGKYRLEGYVSSPVYTRASRQTQYCFVNQRPIRDKVILHATQHGYSHLLPKGRHPVIFLFLAMDPHLLDVNVHPSKSEVRFAFQQEVHLLVSGAVRTGLSRSEKGPAPALPYEGPPSPGTGWQKVSETPAAYKAGSLGPGGSAAPPAPAASYRKDQHEAVARALGDFYKGPPATPRGVETADLTPRPISDAIYSEFEPLGQLDRSFILMQGKRGILVVDQHIAHERVLYEQFRKTAEARRVEVQKLLFPVSLEFSPAEAALLADHLEWLGGLGLELEPFGSHGFLLRSVPALLKNDDHEQVLRAIAERLPESRDARSLEAKYEEILIMMSCRGAIKVNHTLGLEQIRRLLDDLQKAELPYTCPHGRPIALLFEMDDLLRRFLRK